MIFVLVILSLVLVGFALWAFFWAVKNDQFDDLETHAYSILDDDKPENTPSNEEE
jgi:cbb3-type cytochrome oxidase maturation protein